MAENGTIAYIDTPKLCDYHKGAAEQNIRDNADKLTDPEKKQIMEEVPLATFDLKTLYGYWANCCDSCAKKYAMYPGLLGVGRGQKLEVRSV